ncbi:unnamed protein product [Oikopleura dioica]|uniref:Transient receptor ion channel domain-containing protein n=1 Tax=Oikopleura dioica TaxID=34765 RepID=E4Y9Z5_OIKDI|nr:unnamed protein product [Oikopleura dioica]
MLTECTELDVNCTDFIGQNSLQLATGNEHLEVVETLLAQPKIKRIGDALMLSISKGYDRIVEAILSHDDFKVEDRLTISPAEQRRRSLDSDFYTYDGAETRFSPDITPIILASQCQEYEIVHQLLIRGARIERPHNYHCQCEDCSRSRCVDSFSHSLSRINAYKGLASPAYLALSSPDPMMSALYLSNELANLAEIEKEFKNEYQKLSNQCKDFSVSLLDLCWNHSEVSAILNNHNLEEESKNWNNSQPGLDTLKLAIRYQVKKFVAHPNCQHELLTQWFDNSCHLGQAGVWVKVFAILLLAICMPLTSVVHWFMPKSRLGAFVASPYVKFVNHAVSFVLFLLLLVTSSIDRFEWVEVEPNNWFIPHQDLPYGRHNKLNWIEYTLMLYIFGRLLNEVKELWEQGPRDYCCQLWNILDFVMLSTFITSFSLKIVSYQNVSRNYKWWDSKGESYSMNSTEFNISCGRFERLYWDQYDPQLISESLYAIAIVFSFARISYILPVNEHFGPLQISLGRTVVDIYKWAVLFAMIFASFMFGLHALYSYFENGLTYRKNFTTIEQTFITLFWSLFGLSDYRGVELAQYPLSRIIGYLLYGAYSLITVVIMLNMLIAMINNSYNRIDCDSDVEWKFARSKLMLSYFGPGSVNPPPFNLLPSPYFVRSVIDYAMETIKTCLPSARWGKVKNHKIRFYYFFKNFFLHKYSNKMNYLIYSQAFLKDISRRLVKRYVIKAQVEKESEGINEGEIQEIKQDISSLRYELLGKFTPKANFVIEFFRVEQKLCCPASNRHRNRF